MLVSQTRANLSDYAPKRKGQEAPEQQLTALVEAEPGALETAKEKETGKQKEQRGQEGKQEGVEEEEALGGREAGTAGTAGATASAGSGTGSGDGQSVAAASAADKPSTSAIAAPVAALTAAAATATPVSASECRGPGSSPSSGPSSGPGYSPYSIAATGKPPPPPPPPSALQALYSNDRERHRRLEGFMVYGWSRQLSRIARQLQCVPGGESAVYICRWGSAVGGWGEQGVGGSMRRDGRRADVMEATRARRCLVIPAFAMPGHDAW